MTATRIASVQRFKSLTQELRQEVRRDAIEQMNIEADQLVEQMKAVAPAGPTGNLRQSIRKEPGRDELHVRVMAGGPLTTVQRKNYTYDYSRAVEFGTQAHGAHPFFWPSWRLRRGLIRSRMKSRIARNIRRKSA